MSEHEHQDRGLGTMGVLLILLGGMVVLGLLMVAALGFLFVRTTMQREVLMAEEAQQQADLALVQAEREVRRAAEQELALRRAEMLEADANSSNPVTLEQVQRALQTAETFLGHLRAGRRDEAVKQCTPDLQEAAAEPTGVPLLHSPVLQGPPQLVGLQASSRVCRFRYQGSRPNDAHPAGAEPMTFILVLTADDTGAFKVKAVELAADPRLDIAPPGRTP